MNDLQLRHAVLDELEFEPIADAAHIGVAADKGVVTLSGHVSRYAEKVAAIGAARRVKGVRGVADELEVRSPFEKSTSDDEIAKRAINVLEWDTLVPKEVQVTVRDGWLTLTGTADWHYQKITAEEDVHKLTGVRGVTNNIVISPRVRPGDIKQKIEEALKRRASTEARSINVSVEDGNRVVLEGKVENWAEAAEVEKAAWSAPGVKAIEDRLSVG